MGANVNYCLENVRHFDRKRPSIPKNPVLNAWYAYLVHKIGYQAFRTDPEMTIKNKTSNKQRIERKLNFEICLEPKISLPECLACPNKNTSSPKGKQGLGWP